MNAGNKTTYKRAEGETTQWEDIHRKLGNFAPAEPVWKPDPFESEEDLGKGKAWVDHQDVQQLEELEDEFSDDRFLHEYRHKRLQELRQTAKQPQFGLVTNIIRADFIPEVTSASKDVWVIVHLYKDKIADCAQMDASLQVLAAKFTRTKFLRIISTDCIPNYPDRNLPTLLVYKDTQCKHSLVGATPFGGRITPESLASTLRRLGPIIDEKHD